MDSVSHPAGEELDSAIADGDAGTVVRIVRQRRGMTQAQLGSIVGYSPSAISRLERGRLPLRDVTILRLLASALAIRPEALGVSAQQNPSGPTSIGSLDAFNDPGGGAVQRRRFLVSAASIAGGGLLRTDAFAAPARSTTADAIRNLERACLTTSPSSRLLTLPAVAASLQAARIDFATGHYSLAIHRLADILKTETQLIDQSPSRPDPHVVLAHAYALATEILIKTGGGTTTMIVADRAVRAARLSGSATAFAAASRQLATVLRHDGRFDSSIRIAVEATDRLRAAGINTPLASAAYAQSLCTTAYIVANSGNGGFAVDLLREAAHSVRRTVPGQGQFDLAGVTLYSIGVHYALGDAAAAVTAARQIRPEQLPTPERRARYWCDVARAWSQYGHPQHTYSALVAAFREAPGEVRDRSSMHGLVVSLMAHDRRLPGLRLFANRVNALA